VAIVVGAVDVVVVVVVVVVAGVLVVGLELVVEAAVEGGADDELSAESSLPPQAAPINPNTKMIARSLISRTPHIDIVSKKIATAGR